MKAIDSIKKDREFRSVYQSGKSMANRLLIVYMKNNHTDGNRIGFTVSKKVGKSVVRSRVKRLMKESARLNQDRFKKGYDIVFVARPSCKDATYKEVESAMLHLIRKIKL